MVGNHSIYKGTEGFPQNEGNQVATDTLKPKFVYNKNSELVSVVDL